MNLEARPRRSDVINCGRVTSATLRGHLVIGCSLLVNETSKHRSSPPMSVNLRRYKRAHVSASKEYYTQRLAR